MNTTDITNVYQLAIGTSIATRSGLKSGTYAGTTRPGSDRHILELTDKYGSFTEFVSGRQLAQRYVIVEAA